MGWTFRFCSFGLRNSAHSSINETPFFVTNGKDIRLPYDVLATESLFNYNDQPSYCEQLIPSLSKVYENVKANLEAVADKHVKNRSKLTKNIKVDDFVMLHILVIKPGLLKKFAKCNSSNYASWQIKHTNNGGGLNIETFQHTIWLHFISWGEGTF